MFIMFQQLASYTVVLARAILRSLWLPCTAHMSQLKKLLGIKKKSRSTEHVAGADHDNEAGYTNVKEKDLSKLHKAAWNGDLARVKQVLNKTGKKGEDINQLDKQNRSVSSSDVYYSTHPFCHSNAPRRQSDSARFSCKSDDWLGLFTGRHSIWHVCVVTWTWWPIFSPPKQEQISVTTPANHR